MGLDMYLYRITALTDEEKAGLATTDYDDIQNSGKGFCCQALDDDDDEDEMADEGLAQIMPWCTVVEKDVKYIDFDKLKEICKIPEDASLGGSYHSSSGRCVYSFHKDGNSYEAVWSDLTDEQKAQATRTERRRVAVWKEKEIAYWRKEYDLQSAIHGACGTCILNCGYYPLNDGMKKAIVKFEHRHASEYDPQVEMYDLEATEHSVVAYHEWY